MRKPKHLPLHQWPEADREAFRAVFADGDIFDDTGGPGSHLAKGSRTMIVGSYRRWLAFLTETCPEDLPRAPADRITPERVRTLITHLGTEVRPTSVAMVVTGLYHAARMIAPDRDWDWLRALKSRLLALAEPEDRFERLVPPWQLLDAGIELMDDAIDLPVTNCKQREIQYRDGLLLAVLSLWPIRRRSIAAMTVSDHVEFDAEGVNLLLASRDTKARRAESFRVPECLVPYLKRYLDEMRPRLLGHRDHDALWVSWRGRPMCGCGIYDVVRRRTAERFGKPMGLHDVRRAAATFLATDAPEKVGLIPGLLQHTSPEVGERHYNLARSTTASRRFGATIAALRADLGPRRRAQKG